MADPTLDDAMNSLAMGAQQSQGDMGSYGMGQLSLQPQMGGGQQRQPMQQPQPMPLPWGQPDEIELAQLQQGLRSVQRDAAQNTISPPTAQEATQKIHGQLQPLLARQQQAQSQQTQKMTQAAMQDAAMQEGILNVHQKSRAKSFPETVAAFTDPVTGDTEHFYQDAKGSWKPVEFSREEKRREREAKADEMFQLDEKQQQQGRQPQMPNFQEPAPLGPGGVPQQVAPPRQQQPRGFNLAGAIASTDPIAGVGQAGEGVDESGPSTGIPASEELGQQPPQTLRQVAARAMGLKAAAPVSTPRILNAAGDDITASQHRQFGQTQATPRDELGRPTGPPPGEPGSGMEEGQHLSQQGLQELFRRAEAAVPRLPQGADPHLQLHRQELVSGLVQKMVDNHHGHLRAQERAQLTAQEHRQQEQSQAGEHQRKQEAESAENQRKEQARSEESQRKEQEKQEGADKESLAHRSQELRHITGDARDEAMKYREKIPKAQWPEWMKNEDSIDQEINVRYQKHLKRLGVSSGKPKQRSGPDAEAQKIAGMLLGGQGGQVAKEPTPSAATATNPQEAEQARKLFDEQLQAVRLHGKHFLKPKGIELLQRHGYNLDALTPARGSGPDFTASTGRLLDILTGGGK